MAPLVFANSSEIFAHYLIQHYFRKVRVQRTATFENCAEYICFPPTSQPFILHQFSKRAAEVPFPAAMLRSSPRERVESTRKDESSGKYVLELILRSRCHGQMIRSRVSRLRHDWETAKSCFGGGRIRLLRKVGNFMAILELVPQPSPKTFS